jgi:hypothetical protein
MLRPRQMTDLPGDMTETAGREPMPLLLGDFVEDSLRESTGEMERLQHKFNARHLFPVLLQWR